MAYANNRRAAANVESKSFATKRETATAGSVERCAIEKKLAPADKKLIELFREEQGKKRSPSEVFTVFRCQVPEAPRFFIETDTRIGGVVVDIVGLDYAMMHPTDENGNDYTLLPAFPLNNEEYVKNTPRFDGVLNAWFCFPKYDDEKKTLRADGKNADGSYRAVTELHVFERYASVFMDTAKEYFRTADPKHALNAWKVFHTLGIVRAHYFGEDKDTIAAVTAKLPKFKALVEKRDSSLQCAVEYKRFADALPPHQHYWLQYQLMLESPELVHKSHMSRLDLFLFGLISQDALGANGCALGGIEDHLLRMVFERTIKTVPKPGNKTRECADPQELVANLHQGAGKSVQRSLRYWAQMRETTALLLQRRYSASEFVARLDQIRTHIGGLNGILPFCFLIYPDSHRYLDDLVTAEFIYLAGTADKSFTVLTHNMFVTKIVPTHVPALARENATRIAKFREMMEAEAKHETKNADTKETEDAPRDLWAEVTKEAGDIQSNPWMQRAFWRKLIAVASTGDAGHIAPLEALIDAPADRGNKVYGPPVARRRAVATIIRVAPPGSAIYEHFAMQRRRSDLIDLRRHRPSMKWLHGKVLCDAARAAAPVVVPPPVATDDVEPIEFVKFELSRQQAERIRAILRNEGKPENKADSKAENPVAEECPICSEVISGERPLVDLHKLAPSVARHAVCSSCVKLNLGACPFCRMQL
ncbi:MAG: hypothetical protein KGL39_13105 [Patescibacteria group bacterium]|nr:hypothetical protein [Patescibacteria group bacterium]